jgi:hypothetical protein
MSARVILIKNFVAEYIKDTNKPPSGGIIDLYGGFYFISNSKILA